jgi:hypothetical protein
MYPKLVEFTEFAGLLKCGVFVAFIASARN